MKNFPILENLTLLEMNGNEMRIMNWMPLLKCKNLRALALRGNYIKRFDELQDFVKLENF